MKTLSRVTRACVLFLIAFGEQSYPWTGVNGETKDRQGELFYYMHQQMLARYDA